METGLKAIIADDEEPLRRYLKSKINKVWPEIDSISEAKNGIEALELIKETSPDIAFLDIKMPGFSGIDLADDIPDSTLIVFITAYEDYAVEAFNKNAADYLLKPVSEERLYKTSMKLKEIIEFNRQKLRHNSNIQWIKAQHGRTIKVIPVEKVVCFKAEYKYTSVYTNEDVYCIRTPIKTLASSLDENRFWHIHRNAIINPYHIKSVSHSTGGKFTIKMDYIDEPLIVSRRFSYLFKQM